MFSILTFIATNAQPRGNYLSSIIMILLAIVFFYFILWRPEKKRRKKAQEQRESLKIGDKITAMGMIGTVDKIQNDTIIIKTYDDSSKIEILKAAITQVHKEDSDQDNKK